MKRYELISLTLKDNKTNEIKEVLYDELDIINLFNKLDTKWQKLKEWLKNQITDLRRIEIKTKTQSLRVNDAVNCFREVLCKMQELEKEDDKD